LRQLVFCFDGLNPIGAAIESFALKQITAAAA